MLLENWSLGGWAFYENGTEDSGPNSEDFDRIGGNIALSRQLGKHLTLSIYYSVIAKESSVFSYGYNQQVFGSNINYNF